MMIAADKFLRARFCEQLRSNLCLAPLEMRQLILTRSVNEAMV
jgi:hypothetical protein